MKKNADQDSFILNDFNSTWKYAQELSKLGIPGIFPTEEDRRLETDREYAKEFIKKHYKNVEVAEEREFDSVEEAIKAIEDSDSSFVIKGNSENAPTFVPDTEDIDAANESVIKKLQDEKAVYEEEGFILEKRIKNPVELTPQAWFVDGEMVATSLDIELKRLGAGDVGPMTGCGADLVFETPMESEINKIAFPPIVNEMAKKHKGVFIWDLALLFDPENGTPYASEFCPCRPGYNAFYSELAHQDSKKKFFELLMDGKNPYEGKAGEFASSVRVFNFKPTDGQMEVVEGKSVSMDDDTENDAWMMDVKEGKEGLETVGYDYQLGVITGIGDTVQQAAKWCYLYLSGLHFEDKVYRAESDYLSKKYPTSILNRYDYAKKKGLL